MARASLQRRPEAVPDLLAEAARELDAGLAELREIARGLHPAVLVEHGLAFALKALAERVAVPVTLEVPDERLPEILEATAYYIASEALTNVAKHAEATRAHRHDRPRRRACCAAASPTTAAAAPTPRAAAACSDCATAPRPSAGRCRSSARRDEARRCVAARCRYLSADVVTSAMGELKAATAAHHERLERRVDIERHLRSRDAYRELLERFYGFYRPIEAVLAPFAGPFTPRHPLLAPDITALGGDVATPAARHPPAGRCTRCATRSASCTCSKARRSAAR